MNLRATKLIETAERWLKHGFSVAPAQPKSKVTLMRWRLLENKQPTKADLYNWFSLGVANMALVCGTGSFKRLLVLDFDDPLHAENFEKRAGSLAKTLIETTGRGFHFFYLVDNPTTKVFTECEALGLGHLCLTSPSIHPTGSTYQFVTSAADPTPRVDNQESILVVQTETLFTLLSEKPNPRDRKSFLPPSIAKAVKPNREAKKAGNTFQDTVSRVKEIVSIVSLAKQLTELTPSGRGRYWLGKCPFHQDEHPSFWVDDELGLWGCFVSNCQGHRGGDVINLIALVQNISNGDAVRVLAKELP